MMEGSGSGSVPLTNSSGLGGPKTYGSLGSGTLESSYKVFFATAKCCAKMLLSMKTQRHKIFLTFLNASAKCRKLSETLFDVIKHMHSKNIQTFYV